MSYIGIAREKINRLEHTTGCSQNKGTEKLQRRASLHWTGRYLPEVGGRGRGKWQTQPQRSHPLPHCRQASSFYPKTPWDSGWLTSTTGRVVARCRLLRTNTSHWHPTSARRNRLGPRRGKGAPPPGRMLPSSPWLPKPLRPGKTQNAGATKSTLLWSTRKLEPHAMQGPFPIEQPGAWAV